MWIMSQRREERPVRYTYFIGEVPVASVHFVGGSAVLTTGDAVESFATMSEALTEMHRRLNAPAPAANTVGRSL
jgi:hypothetical protein